jgi:hypothetical protein
MDKTGAETAKPTGAFSQIDQAEKTNNALQE